MDETDSRSSEAENQIRKMEEVIHEIKEFLNRHNGVP